MASRAQELALKEVFHIINYCDATTLVSMISARLHFRLEFINPNRVTAQESKVTRKNTKNKETIS